MSVRFRPRAPFQILNANRSGKIGSPSILSQFKTTTLDSYTADQISWTGTGLSIDQGWHDVAGGTLFIHADAHFDPLRWTEDVEKAGDNYFAYRNGYVLRRSETRCVYHLVIFRDKIELGLAFSEHPDTVLEGGRTHPGRNPWPTREELYGIATKALPKPEGLLADAKKGAINDGIKMAIDQVPNIVSLFGRLF